MFFASDFCRRALSPSGRLLKGVCMPSPLAGLITVILSCLVYPGKPWNADDLKCSGRCAGQVRRQRTLYTCFKVLSLRADFKMLLLVFESFKWLILSMAWVSDMLVWCVPLLLHYLVSMPGVRLFLGQPVRGVLNETVSRTFLPKNSHRQLTDWLWSHSNFNHVWD